MRQDEFDQQVEALALLGEPVRRALYRHVARQPAEVSRDEAASAVGISRILAAFHLDRLVKAGLLEPVYRRLSGRSGPGAGRTSKLYRRASRQFRLQLPERRYELLAKLLAQALEADPSRSRAARLSEAANQLGIRLGQEAVKRAGTTQRGRLLTEALRILDENGFEPAREGEWITLRNCPFDAVATEHRELVCGMNLSLMSGLGASLRSRALEARREPAEGRCCVRLRIAGAERKNG